jgi:hypothetical protein
MRMHRAGLATRSGWQGDELVGGFYGVLLGRVFFGEAMLTPSPMRRNGVAVFARHFFGAMGGGMIDSQVYTDHIARSGAQHFPRRYIRKLGDLLWSGASGEASSPPDGMPNHVPAALFRAYVSGASFPFRRGSGSRIFSPVDRFRRLRPRARVNLYPTPRIV